jgi:zinc protease
VIRAFAHASAGLALFLLALPAWAEIDIQEVTSPGGITAWLVEDHSIPILSIEADFRGGTALDPEGKEGATNLMMGLLEEGAGDLDATGFYEAVEAVAAHFNYDAGLDSVTVSAEMLSEFRDESLALFRASLVEPRFDDAAIDRVRGQVMATLRADESDPNELAGQAFFEAAFPGHAYARRSEGTPESVASLDAADMRAAHGAAMVRDRLKVAVAGDITAAELAAMLDDLFGALPASGPERPAWTAPATEGGLRVIDFDIPQSVVIFGHEGIAREDPDFIPAYVMNRILGGGGFGSRLTEEVREKRGLTYGIYTYPWPGDLGWLFMGGFSSANAVAAQAVELVRQEWARMAEQGVTEAELEDAKRYLTGAYPLRFDGNQRIADQLLGLQTADLGIDYVNERNALIEAVTVEDIARIAARLLRPDDLTFVVVGRPEGIDATN